jgi:hypothetical protein
MKVKPEQPAAETPAERVHRRAGTPERRPISRPAAGNLLIEIHSSRFSAANLDSSWSFGLKSVVVVVQCTRLTAIELRRSAPARWRGDGVVAVLGRWRKTYSGRAQKRAASTRLIWLTTSSSSSSSPSSTSTLW